MTNAKVDSVRSGIKVEQISLLSIRQVANSFISKVTYKNGCMQESMYIVFAQTFYFIAIR